MDINMESEPISGDLDATEECSSPGAHLPRPDFTEVIDDSPKNEAQVPKPTFKSALQAKKRLQAFSSNRSGSLPASPLTKKLKLAHSGDEKSDSGKKAPKKVNPDDKAKAVIEEIEALKRREQAHLESIIRKNERRSHSRSSDRERFKKVEKRSRNYRRRLPTPERNKKSVRKSRRSPKNSKTVENCEAPTNSKENNELLRQMLFESPSLPISPFKFKTVNKDDKTIPFEYVRYTRTKPIISYNVNCISIKHPCLSRQLLFQAIPKDRIAIMEKLYTNSIKFKSDVTEIKVRNWYPKFWTEIETNECKLLEKSVGLSFLQTYTGEDEETEPIDNVDEEKLMEVNDVETEKKKKKKTKNADDGVDCVDKKKKKRKKKKHMDGDMGDGKKKKRKKDKVKKDKTKEKKMKKKKEKRTDADNKIDKPSKEQVMEELRRIEEQLAKKRSETSKNDDENDDERKEKTSKRKNSDIGDSTKRVKLSKSKSHHSKTDDACEKRTDRKSKEIDDHDKKVKSHDEEPFRHKSKDLDDFVERKRDDHRHRSIDLEESSKRGERQRSRDIDDLLQKEEHRRIKEFEEQHQSEERKGLKSVEERRKSRDREDAVKKTESVRKKSKDREDSTKKSKEPSLTDGKSKDGEEGIEQAPKAHAKEHTPDTDEYHSLWESDDDVTIHRQAVTKTNRSWESDEELFGRTYHRTRSNQTQHNYDKLEIPLNIQNFSRRSTKWDEKKTSYFSAENELKLLEEERKSLSEERRKLEIEKQKILKLQQESKYNYDDNVDAKMARPRSSTPDPEQMVKVKKEKCDIMDFNIDSLNSSLLSNVSSVESNFPITALENEYEEFIKAVSSDSSNQMKKREMLKKSRSTSSSSSSSDSDHKKKKRKAKMKKKKKRKYDGLLPGKVNNIFNEFDIPVPSDLPEIVPIPVPVPSPTLPIPNLIGASSILFNLDTPKLEDAEKPSESGGLDLIKPFVFSSITLPTKKSLLDNSTVNLNDEDSESADFTDKFVKKEDGKKVDDVEEPTIDEIPTEKSSNIEEIPPQSPVVMTETVNEPPPLKQSPVVSAIVEAPTPVPIANKVEKVKSPERKSSSEKRRSRSRSRDRKRRDLTPLPSRRRYSSPLRRRSPIRRRGSPRRRSPSPRRRSPSPRRRSLSPRRRSPSPRWRSPPLRRRRRSPSLSPARRSRNKRTPSPSRIRRSSPLNSPLDGFKRSVADSTISDDMLPQPDDYAESPPVLKYFDRKLGKSGLSPTASPRRISLDDRINQVLGLEKNDVKQPMSTIEYHHFNPYHSGSNPYLPYGPGQYPPTNQYSGQKIEYASPYPPPPRFSQPPPPIAKAQQQQQHPPIATKVVQIGNILQVVPSEEIPQHPSSVEKIAETSQKIVQVGNMLQIVPAVLPPGTPQLTMPPETPVIVTSPEKHSAEALMKQKNAERKAEREKRRLERERRRKDKEKKRKEKEKRKQMKIKLKTENMIKRALQLETEALAGEEPEEEVDGAETPIQWPPVNIIVSATPSGKGILTAGSGGSKKRKSVKFADGVRPGEGTSPSGGEELSSPPPNPPTKVLTKEKRFKKMKVPKKSRKKKIKVKVVKRVAAVAAAEELMDDDDDDEEDVAPPPSPPPGSPPPHVFPSRVKTHTINNVHQFVIPGGAPGFAFRPMVMDRGPPHQPPPGYLPPGYHPNVASMNSLSHPPPTYQGVSSHH